jgi:hypothetical protein
MYTPGGEGEVFHVKQTVDLDALEALAKEATAGPWEWDAIAPFRVSDGGRGNMVAYAASNEPHPKEQIADAMYIAAASPDVVLGLIGELRRLQGVLTAVGSGYPASEV